MMYRNYFCFLLSIMLCSIHGYSQEQITIQKSDTVIDCNGGLFNEGKATYLVISSKNTSAGWVQTKNVTIQNCTIKGGIRIIGLGKNGQAAEVKASSISLGHTERAQAAAPTNITFSNVTIETTEGLTLLYIAPGTTYVTVENCIFSGENTGSGPVVYLDAESGYNTFRNNTFNASVSREIIACDGSAYNIFEGNKFETLTKGGIYLYRNCGEGGTVRHQTPNHNIIKNNTFNLSNLVFGNYGIWLGSRDGNRTYCDDDSGYPFGSSMDDSDFADYNIVNSNVFTGGYSIGELKNNGDNNQINVVSAITNVDTANEQTINLNDGKITLNNLKNNTFLNVYDCMGRTILSKLVTDSVINNPSQTKGFCFIQLSNKDKVVTKKFIVK